MFTHILPALPIAISPLPSSNAMTLPAITHLIDKTWQYMKIFIAEILWGLANVGCVAAVSDLHPPKKKQKKNNNNKKTVKSAISSLSQHDYLFVYMQDIVQTATWKCNGTVIFWVYVRGRGGISVMGYFRDFFLFVRQFHALVFHRMKWSLN